MNRIVTGDWHLVDKPSDAYRLKVFDRIEEACRSDSTIYAIDMLGDITDFKDRHSAQLVNTIVQRFTELAQLPQITQINVLFGNHDSATDAPNMFFRFLSLIPKIRVITQITEDADGTLWLPNTRNPRDDWQGLDFSQYRRVYGHQASLGAKLSEGYSLGHGIDPHLFDGMTGWALFSDIHIPQQLAKNFISVGAPARFRFGDTYTPRLLLVSDTNQVVDLPTGLLVKHKVTIRSTDDLDTSLFQQGDQVKVVVTLRERDYEQWLTIRKAVQDKLTSLGVIHQVELHKIQRVVIKASTKTAPIQAGAAAVSFDKVISRWSQKERLGEDIIKAGEEIVVTVDA